MARRKADVVDVDALLKERLRELGSKGGRKSADSLSPTERTEKARSAAEARWKKAKKKPATKGKTAASQGKKEPK
jgi:hypothetical protein